MYFVCHTWGFYYMIYHFEQKYHGCRQKGSLKSLSVCQGQKIKGTSLGEHSWSSLSVIILPETNVAPKNGWLEMYFPIGEVYFQVRTVSVREGIEKHSHFVWISLAMVIRDLVLPHFLLEVLVCFSYFFLQAYVDGDWIGEFPKKGTKTILHGNWTLILFQWCFGS